MQAAACDILVIGSGIAGLSFALHCAENMPQRRITVVSKGAFNESNTYYAQGGIAAVMNRLRDSFTQHIEDTLAAGDGLCNPAIVELVVRDAPRQMWKLADWGVTFDREGKALALGKEGGHSAHRILHVKDHTGAHIGEALWRKALQMPNISHLEHHFVSRLLQEKDRCAGAVVVHQGESYALPAAYTMLATGGAGQLYPRSSNPPVATGDGFALGASLGATLQHMAFVQFHPTVLYEKKATQSFLISEALRGFGAILRDKQGEDFMLRYHPRGSLATRDIVARAIFMEMQRQQLDHLWLDLRELPQAELAQRFPTIYQKVVKVGYQPAREPIPVAPGAHYFCGGLAVDAQAQTSVPGLLACGETACTGLHGANRLASNSLLEALVFAARAAHYLQNKTFPDRPKNAITIPPEGQPLDKDTAAAKLHTLQQLMHEQVGVVRQSKGLQLARRELQALLTTLPQYSTESATQSLRHLILTGLAVVEDSLRQTQNRGGFYRSDIL